MAVPMVNLAEFAHVVALLDRIASPSIVDRATRAFGLGRQAIAQGTGYLPYRAEAEVLEHVARALGDARLGARVAQAFDYPAYDACAAYVLGVEDLAAALSRGRRAFPLIQPGSEIARLIPRPDASDSQRGFTARARGDSPWRAEGGSPWERRSNCGRTRGRTI